MTGAQNRRIFCGCAKTMIMLPENDDKGSKDKGNGRDDMVDYIPIGPINYIEARLDLIDVEDEKVEEKRNCRCEEAILTVL